MKKEVKYAEIEFLKMLVHKRGGLAILARALDVEYTLLNNWMHRGYVPPKHVLKVSQYFKIAPCVLNNKQFHYIGDWKANLKKEKVLSPSELKTVLALPLRYK